MQRSIHEAHGRRGWPGRLASRLLVVATLVAAVMGFAQDNVTSRLRANLARFDSLCRDTNPAPPIRVLIYGQSITARPWTTDAFASLVQRYPGRSWVIENRCIGGVTAPYLLRTAEADLFPFQPDLVVFHAYGDTNAYASLVGEIRRRTTADLLLINDHYALWDASVFPEDGDWCGRILPGMALANGACVADVRTPWREYLLRNGLPLQSLLVDHVHPNADGEAILQETLTRCLMADPPARLKDPMNDGRATRLHIPSSAANSGQWTIPFSGNRVMALAGPGAASFWIDGARPSDTVESRIHGRTSPWPGSWRPFLLRVSHSTPLVEETWTLRIESIEGPGNVRFTVTGSVTGLDGAGTSTQPFRSKSGRVLVEPADWFWEAATPLLAAGSTFTWNTVRLGIDSVLLPTNALPAWTNMVAGLMPSRHELVIVQKPGEPAIRDVIVYSPPEPRPARAMAIVTNNTIVAVNVMDPGYGYTAVPAVTFPAVAGNPTLARARLDHGSVASIEIVQGGVGHPLSLAPAIDAPPRPPRMAAASASISQGRLAAAWVIDGGVGYSTSPEVTIDGGGGSGAFAVARVIDGVVRQIEVIDPGSGYSSVPRVRVAPPGLPPRLSVERIPGALRFRVALSPDSPAQAIEASADLRKWAPFAVLTDPDIPFMEFVPPEASEWMLFRMAP